MSCACRVIPSFGEVGPVGDYVARDVAVTRPVCQWCGERLSEHILQVISMVSSHPAGVGSTNASHTIGLREEVGVGAGRSLVRQGKYRDVTTKTPKRELIKREVTF